MSRITSADSSAWPKHVAGL